MVISRNENLIEVPYLAFSFVDFYSEKLVFLKINTLEKVLP